MAITNYGELQTAVGAWINKSNLSAYIPDFITLAESRIYYGSQDQTLPSRAIRIAAMANTETPTITQTGNVGSFPYPTRYLETIRIQVTDGDPASDVSYITPAQFSMERGGATGYYKYYSKNITSENIFVLGKTGTVTHTYYAKFAPFSANSDANALLTNSPGVYLYAALIEAAMFQVDDNLALRAYRMYSNLCNGLMRVENWHAGPLQMKAR